MQKNKKNGFLFFDLLIALMIAMTFVTVVLSILCFLMSHYTLHKEYIFAGDIISEVLYRIDIGEQLSLRDVKRFGQTDFVITVDREMISHTPIGGIDQMQLVILTVSWISCRNVTEAMRLKTLDKSKLFTYF